MKKSANRHVSTYLGKWLRDKQLGHVASVTHITDEHVFYRLCPGEGNRPDGMTFSAIEERFEILEEPTGKQSHFDVIVYSLVKANQRLTFDIIWQRPDSVYLGADDGDYLVFVASNGFQVISRSRMDIQTERLWLLGARDNERSGSMVFSSNQKRDQAYDGFMLALDEWCESVRAGRFHPRSISLKHESVADELEACDLTGTSPETRAIVLRAVHALRALPTARAVAA
ncbi:TPA: hypothetical protein ACYLN4_007567 [Burkholderia lata]